VVIIATDVGCAITDRLAVVRTRRVDAAARVRDKLRILDLTLAQVRQAVVGSRDVKSLYEAALASDY
jgi:hypothetical protein